MQAIDFTQPSPQAPVGTSIITKEDVELLHIAPRVFQKTLVLVVPTGAEPSKATKTAGRRIAVSARRLTHVAVGYAECDDAQGSAGRRQHDGVQLWATFEKAGGNVQQAGNNRQQIGDHDRSPWLTPSVCQSDLQVQTAIAKLKLCIGKIKMLQLAEEPSGAGLPHFAHKASRC